MLCYGIGVPPMVGSREQKDAPCYARRNNGVHSNRAYTRADAAQAKIYLKLSIVTKRLETIALTTWVVPFLFGY